MPNGKQSRINARHLAQNGLNRLLKAAVASGCTEIEINGVNGHRYLGAGLVGRVEVKIEGVPGNDLGAFMSGPRLVVRGNAQDAVGNTMNSGEIVVHGQVGDVLGYSMRGGSLFVRGDAGYRVGIHMKEIGSSRPVIVIGGRAGDFIGEYMAGGMLVILGLDEEGNLQPGPLTGPHVGIGMHGGVIYLRGEAGLGGGGLLKEKVVAEEEPVLREVIARYSKEFGLPAGKLLKEVFTRLRPVSHRPFQQAYAS